MSDIMYGGGNVAIGARSLCASGNMNVAIGSRGAINHTHTIEDHTHSLHDDIFDYFKETLIKNAQPKLVQFRKMEPPGARLEPSITPMPVTMVCEYCGLISIGGVRCNGCGAPLKLPKPRFIVSKEDVSL